MPYKNKEDKLAFGRRYRRKNPERIRIYQDRYRKKIKDEVFGHYSNNRFVCAICGFRDRRALSIDHIDGNGAEERRRIKKGNNGIGFCGFIFYQYLRKVGLPVGYQVLCMNCQFIKRRTDYDPSALARAHNERK